MTRVEMSFAPVSEVPPAVAKAEAALLSSNATDKRRREFAAGRYAARAAVRRLTGDEDVVILRDAAGAPVIARGLGHVHVSISHADRTAVAVAARTRVGVDIVTVEDHGRPFVREAFATGELRSWARLLRCNERCPLVACAAFAAKEAALKWLRVGLKAPLHSVVLEPREAPCGLYVAGLGDAHTFSAGGVRGWIALRHQQVIALVTDIDADDSLPNGVS